MSFDASWLDLREPADHAARDGRLLARARRHVTAIAAPLIVDLGAGAGSTVRAFSLPDARWRLVDHDAALLAVARQRCGPAAEAIVLDLHEVDAIPLDDARLVTASALFDLVGDDWLDRLIGRLAAARIGLYAALIYDGTMRWAPADPGDAAVTAAFNEHQRRNKGLGPALGPLAGERLLDSLRDRGYRVHTAASPWRLGADRTALQQTLLSGIAAAAEEAGCTGAADWLHRRRATVTNGECYIGHLDVLALPAD